MRELEIHGKAVEIKFNYNFYSRLMEEAQSKQNKKDSSQTVDGFNQLIEGLVDQDPGAIVTAYRAAVVGKTRPTRADVEQALDEAGIWDTENPFNDLYKELQSVGFLRLKVQHLLQLLQEEVVTAKTALEAMQETANKSKESKEEVKQARNGVVLAQKTYEMAKNFIDNLSK